MLAAATPHAGPGGVPTADLLRGGVPAAYLSPEVRSDQPRRDQSFRAGREASTETVAHAEVQRLRHEEHPRMGSARIGVLLFAGFSHQGDVTRRRWLTCCGRWPSMTNLWACLDAERFSTATSLLPRYLARSRSS
jgi:hypothetical protein